MSKTIINIKNLSFSYKKQKVLENINLNFSENKMTVILGRNGSGKSTLLRLIAGLLKAQDISIFYDEKNLNSLSLKKRAAITGFMAQHHQAVFPFKVHEVVLTGRVAHISILPTDMDKEIALKSIEKVGIMHLKDRYYTELSGGEQQLVMIARVLAQQPRVLILDEPISSLDFNNQSHILSVLKSLTKEGLTIICVLHDPNAAILYGDEFVFMKNGRIITPESNENPWTNEFLEDIFELPVETHLYGNKSFVVPKIPCK